MDRERGVEARRVGESLLRVAHRLEQVLADAASREGLSALEARTLRSIGEGVPQGQLALRLGCDPPRVSGLTASLEARGLIVRERDRGDRRVRIARLTPAGVEAAARIGARLAETSPLLTELDDAERAALGGLLARIDPAPASTPKENE